jgi:hypothetical protein
VLLTSDSSDSEQDDRSGTSEGRRPAGSKTEVLGLEEGAAGEVVKACGCSVAPCEVACVDLRFLADSSFEGV